MVALTMLPPVNSRVTSQLTGPSTRRETLPANRFRAESRASARSVAIMTDEALVRARASTPTARPNVSALSRVTTAVKRSPPRNSSSTTVLTAPGVSPHILPYH